MERPNMPESVSMVLNRLLGAGYDAYVVGGALRDMLLGRSAHDWDVATSALPEETARMLESLEGIR